MMETIVKHGGACMHVTGFFAYRDLPCGEASARAFLAQYQSTGVLDFADCLGVYRARIDREDGTSPRPCMKAQHRRKESQIPSPLRNFSILAVRTPMTRSFPA